MQYLRFVSYVFRYENGKKGENIGFAKVEFQNDKIVLNVHFRIRDCINERLQMYLFKVENNRPLGLLVGNGRMKWNTLDMQLAVTEDMMQKCSCLAEELKGIYIQSESGKIFASSWDEGLLQVEEFYPIQSVQTEQLKIAEIEQEAQNEEEPLELVEEERTIEALPVMEELKKTEEEPKAETVITEELHVAEKPDNMQIFEKIDLKQLKSLARKEWVLGNNSFLLHGYYNYHYLCLRKEKETEGVLGVPGIYHPMEKAVAAMYGFKEFYPKEGSEVRTGQFGYWCKTVALERME